MLHIYAALGEKERALIASRTKAVLAAKKVQGVVLGGPKLNEAREASKAVVTASADRHAANGVPIINVEEGGCKHAARDCQCIECAWCADRAGRYVACNDSQKCLGPSGAYYRQPFLSLLKYAMRS
jgi:hypothetical protein